MLTLNISTTDIEYLRYERYNYPCSLVQKRLEVLCLKASTNLSHQKIASVAGVSRNSVTNYIHIWNTSGYEGITNTGYGTNVSDLEKHTTSLLTVFEEEPPHTANEAVQRIEKLTGIKRSPTQVRAWMKRHNLRYRKTGQIPSKADVERQKEFVEQTLEPLIEQAKAEEIHLLFLDAAHIVMGVFLCFLWSVKRIFIKSSSGRKRYNVLGAVNAINQQIHVFTNTTYINAECLIEFLHQLRIYYYDMKPIYIVLDNARYQKCDIVRYIAFQLNIKLVYLPPYSPNLNIIERLWKWLKKRCLYAQYYEKFDDFKKAIDDTLKKANSDFQQEIQSLLTLNFQTF